MRVLHILKSMNRGGVETTLMNIFRSIDKSKVIFDFLLETDEECEYNKEIRELGGKIYSVVPRRKGVIKNKESLNEFFRTHNEYKIVHMHVSSLTYVEPLKIAKKHGVPIRIIHSRNTRQGGSKIHGYLHELNKLCVKDYATDYFACSDLAAKWLYGKKQFENKEYRIINNGILTEKFKYDIKLRRKIRSEFNIDDKKVLGHVGRFHTQKNHEFLLEVFSEYKKVNNNSVLMMIGTGDLMNNIKEKVVEIGLEDSVIFTGARSDVPQLLQAMDIFVMPSFYEGLPGSVIEAQGAGLPCILADTITKEVKITDLVTFLSLNESCYKWVKVIDDKIRNTIREDKQQQIIKNGFDMQAIANDLVEYYIDAVEHIKID